MPADYDLQSRPANAQRRPQHALDEAATRQLIARAHIGHIATVWDAQPFINPTPFWYDAERHAINFHSNIAGRVRANADHHPRQALITSNAPASAAAIIGFSLGRSERVPLGSTSRLPTR
jgi:hypothetical protein